MLHLHLTTDCEPYCVKFMTWFMKQVMTHRKVVTNPKIIVCIGSRCGFIEESELWTLSVWVHYKWLTVFSDSKTRILPALGWTNTPLPAWELIDLCLGISNWTHMINSSKLSKKILWVPPFIKLERGYGDSMAKYKKTKIMKTLKTFLYIVNRNAEKWDTKYTPNLVSNDQLHGDGSE